MSNRTPLSDTDLALFRQAMEGVKPLTEPECHPICEPDFKLPTSLKKTHRHIRTTHEHHAQSASQLTTLHFSDPYECTLSSDCMLSYQASSLSRQTWHDFKQGLRPIDGRLDLHGLTLEQAKQALIHFLEQHIRRQHRVLLLIHGRGAQNARPLLKNAVNHWLPQCPQVLAFVSAKKQHGGSGAVYILLKRSSADLSSKDYSSWIQYRVSHLYHGLV